MSETHKVHLHQLKKQDWNSLNIYKKRIYRTNEEDVNNKKWKYNSGVSKVKSVWCKFLKSGVQRTWHITDNVPEFTFTVQTRTTCSLMDGFSFKDSLPQKADKSEQIQEDTILPVSNHLPSLPPSLPLWSVHNLQHTFCPAAPPTSHSPVGSTESSVCPLF